MHWFRRQDSFSIVLWHFMIIVSKRAGIIRGVKASSLALTLVFPHHSLLFSIDWHEHRPWQS